MTDQSGLFEGALDIVTDAVIVFRQSGEIVQANSAGRALLAEFGAPDTLIDFVEGGEEGFAEMLAPLKATSGNLPLRLVFQGPDGEPQAMKATGRRIRSVGDEAPVFVLKIDRAAKNGFTTLNLKIAELDREVRQRRLAQRTAEEALDANRLLTKELHHRVNNNLQIQASLLRQSAREASSPEIAAFVREATGRLLSMSTGLDLAYRSGYGAVFEISNLLEKLVSQIDESLGPDQEIILVQEGDFLILSEQVTIVALIIHEAVRAIIKAKGGSEPIHLRLTCRKDGEIGRLDIQSTEAHHSAAWSPSTHRLVKALAKQAGATFEWSDDAGSWPRLNFPTINS